MPVNELDGLMTTRELGAIDATVGSSILVDQTGGSCGVGNSWFPKPPISGSNISPTYMS